jgi:hypothetical protein
MLNDIYRAKATAAQNRPNHALHQRAKPSAAKALRRSRWRNIMPPSRWSRLWYIAFF